MRRRKLPELLLTSRVPNLKLDAALSYLDDFHLVSGHGENVARRHIMTDGGI